jgi:AcrR family transcriptional regulator
MTSSYHSPRRAQAAKATREAIVESALALFLERGYENVTVTEIAQAASVAVPTVYASTGGKATILSTLIKPAIGDPAAHETLTAVADADEPETVIGLAAAGTRRAHERHWRVIYGLLRHTPAEAAAREVAEEGVRAYLAALDVIAGRLVELGGLRNGIDRKTAVDVLWFYLGQGAWFTLVGDRGWSFDRAETWLADSARHALLPQTAESDYADRSDSG